MDEVYDKIHVDTKCMIKSTWMNEVYDKIHVDE